jgi:hypothetical protein
VAFNSFSFLTHSSFIYVVAHGSEMTVIGAEQLATYITDLQTKLSIKQTEQGRIALVGCETDKVSFLPSGPMAT